MKRFAILFIFIFLFSSKLFAQVNDTVFAVNKDTSFKIKDTVIAIKPGVNIYGHLLDSCIFLNQTGIPQKLVANTFAPFNNTWLFYSIAFLFLLLGIFKAFYQRYFETLLRVFLNTTLKQNQLTDQLVQAKLPSLIFNILFVIFGGVYLFTLIEFLGNRKIDLQNFKFEYLFFAIVGVGICYGAKYILLQFFGWLANAKQEAKSYIFIIFLLNKVLGIFLLTLLPLIIFGNTALSSFAVLCSIVAIVLAFLLRYYRTFTQLKSKINLSKAHFLLCIICLEALPIAIIFKFCSIILNTKA